MHRVGLVLTASAVLLGVPVWLAGQEADVARGKPVAASTSETASFTPERVVDGVATTRWSSRYEDPQWIRVDLGETHRISRVVLTWEAASARDYSIQVSNDDSTWKTVARRADMPKGARKDELDLAGVGRYVRVYGTARTTQFGYSLWAMEVYGAPAASPKVGGSGLTLNLGCGLSVPLGPPGDMLNLGVSPLLAVGWRLALGPGRLGLGLQTGTVWESTNATVPGSAQYNSFLIPIGAFVEYDLSIAGGFGLYLRGEGGYSATLVFYTPEETEDLGVLKPYAGGAAGLRLDIGDRAGLRAGARFLAVFYGPSTLLCLAPEVGLVFRF